MRVDFWRRDAIFEPFFVAYELPDFPTGYLSKTVIKRIVERLKEFRFLRNQHFDLVMKLDAIAKEKDELETKDSVQISTTKAKNFADSQDFISQKFLSQYQQELKAKMFTAVAEVNKWKRVIISFHDAHEQAKLQLALPMPF